MSGTAHDRLPAPLRAADVAPRSAADLVHHELRRQLLAGRLPYGERLVEEHLAERFQTSRTPVREALRRLEADGHVVRDPAGGSRPNPPRVTAMRETYEVRLVLEELVVRRAAAREPGADADGLARLVAEWHDLRERWPALRDEIEGPDFVHADERFHERLARLSGNRAAVRHLREVNERIRVVRIHDFTTPDRIDETIAEHIEVAEAVVAGDADLACALMRAHVAYSADVVERRVGDLLAHMFDAGGEPGC